MSKPSGTPFPRGMHLHFWEAWPEDIDRSGQARQGVVRAKCIPVDWNYCDDCYHKPCRCARSFPATEWNKGRVREVS